MENTGEQIGKKKSKKGIFIFLIILILITGVVSCNVIPNKITYLGVTTNDDVLCEVNNHKIFSETIRAEDFTLIYNNKVYVATHVGFYGSMFLEFEILVNPGRTKICVKFNDEIINLASKKIYYKNKNIN